MALVGTLPTFHLIALFSITRYKTLGICSDIADNSFIPVALYHLCRLSFHLMVVQIYYSPSLSPSLRCA